MKFIFGLLISILAYVNVFGQNTLGLPQIINYSNTDFKAGAQTWDIKQDKNGIMYFANSEGLLTFDGNHWKLYSLPNKTVVRSILVSNDSKIYVGGQNEIGYFFPNENGTLRYTSLKTLIPKPYSEFADIWDIETSGESVFFRATDRIFELQNKIVHIYPAQSEWRFLENVAGRLIVQHKEKGLLQYSKNGWYPLGGAHPFDKLLVSGIIPLGKDSLLISTLKNGMFLWTGNKYQPYVTQADAELKESQTYYLAAINDNEFAAGTTSHGCIILNKKGEIVQEINHVEGLQNNNILCLFLDKNNNLWAGLNNGISFIAYNSAIKYIWPNKTNGLAVFATLIYNNSLYAATSDGMHQVPLQMNNADLSFSKGNFTQIKGSSGQVWNVNTVNGRLLMGYNDGAFEIINNEAIPITRGTGAWLFAPTSAVYPAERILAGTYIGLEMLGFNNGKFSDLGKIEGVSESFRFLAIDNLNQIWASHPYRGVYRLQLSADEKTYASKLLTAEQGLPSSLGNYVFKIKNRVVFATEKGVYEFDRATQRFKKSEFLEPVFGDTEVRYLKEDNAGNIWFCSNKKAGVVTFNKENNNKHTITWFPELNGQISSGFENIYPYNNQNIFIGSEFGIIHLNFEKYLNIKSQLTVLLSEVKAIGASDTLIFGGHFKEKDGVFQKQDKSEVLVLDNTYNSFHFEYSSPNYGMQKNIEYSYQLQGYDANWSDWTQKTEKDYTNLPAGEYSFHIKARDNLGHESTPVLYSVIVKPAWYNSTLAKMVYLLLAAALLYLFYLIQQRKLRRQRLKFEEEQRRLKELHQLKIEKNEKEIIKLQNEKLANEVKFKNRELADATLHLVERTDALNKVKDQLQRLYKKTENNHDVKKTLQLVNDIEKNHANWEQFAVHFDEVNNDFLKNLKKKFPLLSKTDLKVCAYLQLNLSTKEIAQMMNISVRGVEIARYRLRKKLNVNKEQNLNDFLNDITS